MEAPADRASNVQMAASTLILQRIDVDVIDARTADGKRLEVSGQGNVVAPDLTMVMAPADGATKKDNAVPGPGGQISRLGLDLKRFGYRKVGEVNGFGMQGRIDLGSLKGTLPSTRPGDAPGKIGLSGLGLDVADLDVAMAKGRPPEWRARLDLDLGSASADMQGTTGISGRVDGVSLRRLAAASKGEYGFDGLVIRRSDAALQREAGRQPKQKESGSRENGGGKRVAAR